MKSSLNIDSVMLRLNHDIRCLMFDSVSIVTLNNILLISGIICFSTMYIVSV